MALAPLGLGCSKGISTAVAGTPPHSLTNGLAAGQRPKANGPKARVSKRPANLKGKVFVVEYHHIRSGKGPLFRTKKEFLGDLERLYKDGFRPCTVSQYLANDMDLPPGASPAVFTFDDSNPSQLQLKPDGSVDPDCAVGIWMDFAKTHPDFPVRATFYVLPDTMWLQPKLTKEKVALIHSLGSELGNHTLTHPVLSKLTDEQVKRQIAMATDRLVKFGESAPVSLAFPYGVQPKNKSLLRGFVYKKKKYTLKATLLVGAEPAKSPIDPKLNVYRIPRVQACPGLYGLDYWLDLVEKGKCNVYVSK